MPQATGRSRPRGTQRPDPRARLRRAFRRFDASGREAASARTLLLVLGVLAIQMAFIASYLGAFHRPAPHRVRIAVAAQTGTRTAAQTSAQLNRLPGEPLDAHPVADEATARRQIRERTVYGGLVVTATATGPDTVLVAGAAGASVAQALVEALTRADAAVGRRVRTVDVVPAGDGDARGLSAFYLCVGWIIGGYLVASALTLSRGARPAHVPAATIRLGALGGYALLSGVGGAFIAENILGALTRHHLALFAFGALLVFAAGALTMGLQAFTGIVGVGLVVVLFVVLGNPSAGGAYAWPLLPPFWRTIGPWLLPGSATHAVRGIIYFQGAAVARSVWLLACYAVVGSAATVLAAALRDRRQVDAGSTPVPDAAPTPVADAAPASATRRGGHSRKDGGCPEPPAGHDPGAKR